MFSIEQARVAIQQGDRAKARDILASLVKTEPQNYNAWLLLAEVLENPQQAAYCRERAQTILKNQAQQNISQNNVAVNPVPPTVSREVRQVQAKCPFCAEVIPSDARVCPYCGRSLTQQAVSTPRVAQSQIQVKPNTTKLPESKKGSYWTNIIIAIVIGLCLVCGGIPLMASLETASAPEVRYEVIGSAGTANILWFNAQGGMEQGDYNLPFRKTFTFNNGEYASLTATSYNSGTVTCQIWVNGTLWRESTSSGAYSVVNCNGFIGQQ